ncbi:MAG: peptidoglycan DD-metalloendopeptidase family protein [Lactobacillaceae bacterium]|jgi:murein DD-endopeptidase MepM/ murein hydrolase activator NlpD|nr:peptidoglycan DD-metalloendopeptidase family protein [Lactobacillaceae bacterium]
MKLLNNIKLSLSGNNKQKLIALCYVCAIIAALILSSTRNNNVSASFSDDTIKYIEAIQAFESEITPLNTGYNDAKYSYLENVKDLISKPQKSSEIAGELLTKIIVKEIEVAQGDSFINILTKKIGLTYNEATKVISSYKKVFDATKIRIGQKLKFYVVHDTTEDSNFISLEKIIIEPSIGEKYILVKNINNEYVASVHVEELIEEIKTAQGTVDGTLSAAMSNAGIPNQIVANFINIFSFTVDFRRDLRAGDKFEIIYENKINQEGRVVKSGEIIYASITLRNDKLSLYRYEDTKKHVDYYDEKGQALKRTLHRKPLAFQQARVSSPFGKRRHPIYKDLRIHWGIDYAAPRGTAIFAAGDGVIQAAKYNGGYGNYVRIRHNSEYSTAYGHLHRFASGMKPGVRVKQGQIIGYVGNTGKSTGPHLHYEIIKNGKRVSPTTIKAATGENLKGTNLERFKTTVSNVKSTHSSLFAKSSENEKLAQK